MTELGRGPTAATIFFLFYNFSTREKAFYILFVHTFIAILNCELKMIYRDPRPYMMDPDIMAYSCSKTFGNPSGHSSLSGCFYTSVFLILFHDKDHTLDKYGYML